MPEVPAMSISPREQQALSSIESRLTGSAPALACLLAMFTRLTVGEALPDRERIQLDRRSSWPPRRRRRAGRCHRDRRWSLAWFAVWLVVSVAMIAVALVVGGRGNDPVCTARTPACAWLALPAG